MVLLGTARDSNNSSKVAEFVFETSKKRNDIKPFFVDVKYFPQTKTLGLSKDLNEKWSKLVKETDAFIVICPEYNHGYPGELKLLLDSEYDNYKGKVVGVCGVSEGPVGGARMLEQLRLVFIALNMVNVNACVYFSNVNETFKDNKVSDEEKWSKRINGLIDEILLFSK